MVRLVALVRSGILYSCALARALRTSGSAGEELWDLLKAGSTFRSREDCILTRFCSGVDVNHPSQIWRRQQHGGCRYSDADYVTSEFHWSARATPDAGASVRALTPNSTPEIIGILQRLKPCHVIQTRRRGSWRPWLRDVEKAPALEGISGRVWGLRGNIKGSSFVCAGG